MIKHFAHKIIALVLVIILFAHNINTLVIIGNFVINQDFIAKTLCIQKDDQKGCNGKCHLRKQLTQNDSDPNSKLPFQEHKRTSLDFYCMFANEGLKKPLGIYTLPKPKTTYNTLKIVKTYLEVETPPPILS